jgi:hypothetical protein
MPRNGSLTLSDVRSPTLSIVCEPCRRRGRYGVERLMAEHGDAKLTDLLVTLANCDRARQVPRSPRLDPLRSALAKLDPAAALRRRPAAKNAEPAAQRLCAHEKSPPPACGVLPAPRSVRVLLNDRRHWHRTVRQRARVWADLIRHENRPIRQHPHYHERRESDRQ